MYCHFIRSIFVSCSRYHARPPPPPPPHRWASFAALPWNKNIRAKAPGKHLFPYAHDHSTPPPPPPSPLRTPLNIEENFCSILQHCAGADSMEASRSGSQGLAGQHSPALRGQGRLPGHSQGAHQSEGLRERQVCIKTNIITIASF